MMNLKIRTLEDDIIKLINNSDVSTEIKRLILSDVLNLVIKQADKEVIAEVANNAESASEHQLGE